MITILEASKTAYSASSWKLNCDISTTGDPRTFKLILGVFSWIDGKYHYYGPSGENIDWVSAGHASSWDDSLVDNKYIYEPDFQYVRNVTPTQLNSLPDWLNVSFPANCRIIKVYNGAGTIADSDIFNISSIAVGPITSNGWNFHLVQVEAMGGFRADVDINLDDQRNLLLDSFLCFIQVGTGAIPTADKYLGPSGLSSTLAGAGYPTSWDQVDVDNKFIYRNITSLRQADPADLDWQGWSSQSSGMFWIGLYIKGLVEGEVVYVKTPTVPLQIVTYTDSRTINTTGHFTNVAGFYHFQAWLGKRKNGIQFYPESYITSNYNLIENYSAKHLLKHHAYNMVQPNGRIFDSGNASLRYLEQLRFQINEIEFKILRKSTLTKWSDADNTNGISLTSNNSSWDGDQDYYTLDRVWVDDDTSAISGSHSTTTCYPRFKTGILAAQIDGENDNYGLPVGEEVGKARWTYIKEMREAIERILNDLYGANIAEDDHSFLRWALGDTNIVRTTSRNNSSGGGIQRGVIVYKPGTNIKVKNISPEFNTSQGTIWIGKGSHEQGDYDPYNNPNYPYDVLPAKMLVQIVYRFTYGGGSVNPQWKEERRDVTESGPWEIVHDWENFTWSTGSMPDSGGGVSTYCKWFDITSDDGTLISSSSLNTELQNLDDGGGDNPEVLLVNLLAVKPALKNEDYTRFNWVDWNYVPNGSNEVEANKGKINITKNDGITLQPDLPTYWIPVRTRAEQDTYSYENFDRITTSTAWNYPGYRAIWLEEIQIAINNIGSGYIPVVADMQNEVLINPEEVELSNGATFSSYNTQHFYKQYSDTWTVQDGQDPPHTWEHREEYRNFPGAIERKKLHWLDRWTHGNLLAVDPAGSGSTPFCGYFFEKTADHKVVRHFYQSSVPGDDNWKKAASWITMTKDENDTLSSEWSSILRQNFHGTFLGYVTGSW